MENNLSTTISKFEIIGSYVVHLYFNEFYMQSKKLYVNKAYPTIVDGYKNILYDYSKFIKSERFFKNIIAGINMNCKTVTVYTNMNEAECINFMVKEFIPESVYNDVKFENKKSILTIILSNCLQKFSHEILINHIDSVIEHRNNNAVVKLQDMFLNIIKLEKDKMFSKFINPSPNNVPADLFTNIQKKLLDLSKTKKDLALQNNNLNKANKDLTEKMSQLLESNLVNNKKIKELEQENRKLLRNVSMLNKELTENSEKIETLQEKMKTMTYESDNSSVASEEDKEESEEKLAQFDYITTTNNKPKLQDITDAFDNNPNFNAKLTYNDTNDETDNIVD